MLHESFINSFLKCADAGNPTPASQHEVDQHGEGFLNIDPKDVEINEPKEYAGDTPDSKRVTELPAADRGMT